MASESSASPSAPPPGLPPVQPPSGRFIAQLFLVPGLIVLVAVLIILFLNYIAFGGHTPDYFLAGLASENSDIRWRRAHDLAQVLKRKEAMNLKSNVDFAMQLSERLESALEELHRDEADLKDTDSKSQGKLLAKINRQREFVLFLMGATGDFYMPIALPIFKEILERPQGPDRAGHHYMRRQALLALASMGENLKQFKTLPPEIQAKILEDLNAQVDSQNARRALYARNALHYLNPSSAASTEGLVQVDRLLAEAAKSEDQFQRQQVALTLQLWDGPLVEPTLLELSRDPGFGEVFKVD